MTGVLVVPVGVVGLVLGGVAHVRRDRRAATTSAACGLLTALMAVAVHGWSLVAAFDAVERAPADAKSALLAQNVSEAMWALPVGFGLAAAVVVVSTAAWWRLRRLDPPAPPAPSG